MTSGSAARVRPAWKTLAIGWALASLAGLVIAMAGMTIDRARTVEAGAHNLRELWPFWIASASLWGALTVLWLVLRRENASMATKRFGRDAMVVMLVAIAVRAAVLITHSPAISDDVNRYIFDGRNLAAGENPYLVLPQNALQRETERWPGEKDLAKLITYPELATPYLPVSQLVFGAVGLTIGERWSDPISSARVFRTAFVVIEIIMMLVMLSALRHAGRSAWWLALYAWHPLPISEVAGSGHQDIIGIVFLVAALTAFSMRPGKTVRWSALLALSALGKPFTLPAGARMLRGRPLREWLVAIGTGAAIGVLALAPSWMLWGDGFRGYHNWRATTDVLAEKFAHFGGLYEPVLWTVQKAMPAEGQPAGFNLKQEWLARKICVGALALVAIGVFFSRMNAWQATRAILFALVLLTTTAHPWYLLWAFALVPMAVSPGLWIASLTISWGHAVFATIGRADWPVVPAWVYVVAYGPVFIAVTAETLLSWRGTKTAFHR